MRDGLIQGADRKSKERKVTGYNVQGGTPAAVTGLAVGQRIAVSYKVVHPRRKKEIRKWHKGTVKRLGRAGEARIKWDDKAEGKDWVELTTAEYRLL